MSGYDLALKATLLCITGLAVHVSLSPPNPPVKDQNCSVPDTLFEKFVQSITFFSKVPCLFGEYYGTVLRRPDQCVIWVGAIWELPRTLMTFLLHIHLHCSGSLEMTRYICPGFSNPTPMRMTSPAMFVGTISTVMAALLRLWYGCSHFAKGMIHGTLNFVLGVSRHWADYSRLRSRYAPNTS